ncbi:MAG: DUF3850 domain-containing protein [bacterium]|nr:DUF3850 domain-containing protein [bacterium]
MKIEKKIWPKYFEKVLSGDKKFELRLADWECNIGDTLVLREWNSETKEYTGRQIEKEVACVVKSKDLIMFSDEDIEKYGWQVIGFK